jgi:hypothetical protein
MTTLTCPECGSESVLRYQCLSPVEHLLTVLQIHPFRCQLCSHRFRAFSLGRAYPAHLIDRREHRRIAVQMQLAFSGGRLRGEGQVMNLSAGGCMIETSVPVHLDEIYHLELCVADHQPPLELSAIVRSVTGHHVGFKFLPASRDDQRLHALLRDRMREAGQEEAVRMGME